VQKLPGEQFKGWVNLLSLAARNEGDLPPVEDIAFALRMSEKEAQELIDYLIEKGLIDETECGLEPHNWNGRQYKSDVSTERVKRFRKRHETVSETPNETPPEQNRTDTDKHLSDSDESNAPVSKADHRNARFEEWWEVYANKVSRKKSESAWRNLKWAKLGIEPADLIADTHRRHELDPQWLKGFQPNPLTYLNGERWNDDLPAAKLTLPKDRDELWRIRHAIGLQYEFDDLNSCHAEIHRTLKENPELRKVAGL